MRNIQGAVAVVTGAASGIGRALAAQLASLGAELALADVNAAGLDETLSLLGPAKARAYTVDVGDASGGWPMLSLGSPSARIPGVPSFAESAPLIFARGAKGGSDYRRTRYC